MDMNQISALMEQFASSPIQCMELEQKDFRLVLDKCAPVAAVPVPAAAPAAARLGVQLPQGGPGVPDHLLEHGTLVSQLVVLPGLGHLLLQRPLLGQQVF